MCSSDLSAMPCHIIHRDILFDMVEDIIDRLIDHCPAYGCTDSVLHGFILSILFFWFLIRHSETTAVKVSVHGAAIHTPFIPKIAGRINVNTNNSTIPRSAEMIADDLASPQLVKYMELITS